MSLGRPKFADTHCNLDAILAPSLADANACTAVPCRQATNNAAICTDLAAPAPNNATGRVCNCSLSTSFYVSDAAGCVGECLHIMHCVCQADACTAALSAATLAGLVVTALQLFYTCKFDSLALCDACFHPCL